MTEHEHKPYALGCQGDAIVVVRCYRCNKVARVGPAGANVLKASIPYRDWGNLAPPDVAARTIDIKAYSDLNYE